MWSAWLLQYIALFSGIFHQCIGIRYELYGARISLRFDRSRKRRRCSKTGAQNANAWKRLVLMVSKSAVRDPMRYVYVDNSIETNSFASCVSVYLPLKTTVSPTYINWFVGKTKFSINWCCVLQWNVATLQYYIIIASTLLNRDVKSSIIEFLMNERISKNCYSSFLSWIYI